MRSILIPMRDNAAIYFGASPKQPGQTKWYFQKSWLALFAAAIFCQLWGCCDVRPTAKRQKCRMNLQKIYEAMVKYTGLHGDVPRDSDGKPSLAPLLDLRVQAELGIESSLLQCPADKNRMAISYLLNPALDVHDFRSNSTTIIACERNSQHPGVGTRITWVLIGDGAIVAMVLPLNEQDEWRRLFLAGDKHAGHILIDEYYKWYLGEERGYVPNK